MNLRNACDRSRKRISFEKIYVCKNPLTRLQGIFFRGRFTDKHAVLLEGCSSVHGFGLKRALDIIFLNESHEVLAVSRLKPFGICFHRGAKYALELSSGNAEKIGISPGDSLNLNCQSTDAKTISPNMQTVFRNRQSGASMVEFLLVAPLLTYVGVGVVQMGMAYHARNILDYATFEAARVGAVSEADVTKMRGELAYRIGPIFPGNGSSAGVRSAVSEAVAAVNDPIRTQIRIINPTSAVFEDFGVSDPDTGELVLPSTHLQYRSKEIGARSRVTIQDANLLKIEITHGYELRLPWLDVKLPGVEFVLKELMVAANPANAQFYLRGQIPLRAVATVRMQSDAKANHIEAATEGVARPDTDELPVMDDTDVPLESVADESDIEQTNHNGGPNENESGECEGEHGLPTDLAITTIDGEVAEGVCTYLPPDTPIADTPLSEEFSSGVEVTC